MTKKKTKSKPPRPKTDIRKSLIYDYVASLQDDAYQLERGYRLGERGIVIKHIHDQEYLYIVVHPRTRYYIKLIDLCMYLPKESKIITVYEDDAVLIKMKANLLKFNAIVGSSRKRIESGQFRDFASHARIQFKTELARYEKLMKKIVEHDKQLGVCDE